MFKPYSGEESRARTEQSFLVPKGEIAENGCDLSINKYKKTEYVPMEYPPASEIFARLRALEGWYDGKIFRPVSGCNKRRL